MVRMVAAALIAALALAGAAGGAQAQPAPEFAPGELLLGFVSEAAAEEGTRELQALEAERSDGAAGYQVERLDALTTKIVVPTASRSGDPAEREAELGALQELAASFMEDPRIEYAHPNWILGLDRARIAEPVTLESLAGPPRLATQATAAGLPNDPAFAQGLHWHYAPPPMGMNAVGAWRGGHVGSRDVVVAVIDTGVVFDHSDIAGSANVLPGFDFISSDAFAGDGEPGRDADATDRGDGCPSKGEPDGWHGTHVAGTIGIGATNNAVGIAGVGWEIKVLPVRVAGRCGRGSILDIAEAIEWAAGVEAPGVPANPTPAAVINASLGIELACAPASVGRLLDAVEAATKAGAVIVASAGNYGKDIATFSPAGCANVISVAASDQRGRLAPYSNFGDVTIMAPGGDLTRDDDGDGALDGVWSLVRASAGAPSGVAAYEGTSMAAPHVSAAIAIALSLRPELRGDPEAIAEALRASAHAVPKDACGEAACGPGLLDLVSLIENISR